MPALPISALPAAILPLGGSELVPLVQGGVTSSAPSNALATAGGSFLPLSGGTMTGGFQITSMSWSNGVEVCTDFGQVTAFNSVVLFDPNGNLYPEVLGGVAGVITANGVINCKNGLQDSSDSSPPYSVLFNGVTGYPIWVANASFVQQLLLSSSLAPVADGTYVVGAPLTLGGNQGTITTSQGIIVAVQQAS